MDNLVKLAVDSYKNKAAGNYSTEDNMTVLRNALIEANNGSTKLNYKAIRDGKCNGLFAILEEILTATIVEGLPASSPIFNFVEEKRVAEGDKATFYVPDTSLLVVADVANGTQGIRRQRIEFGKTVTVDTQRKVIKIYEELENVLAGRIDFNEFISRVAKSFQAKINQDIVDTFLGVINKVVSPYTTTGSFTDANMLAIIDHVEAATGQTAKILGTRNAVRKLGLAASADAAKDDVYNMGLTA